MTERKVLLYCEKDGLMYVITGNQFDPTTWEQAVLPKEKWEQIKQLDGFGGVILTLDK